MREHSCRTSSAHGGDFSSVIVAAWDAAAAVSVFAFKLERRDAAALARLEGEAAAAGAAVLSFDAAEDDAVRVGRFCPGSSCLYCSGSIFSHLLAPMGTHVEHICPSLMQRHLPISQRVLQLQHAFSLLSCVSAMHTSLAACASFALAGRSSHFSCCCVLMVASPLL